MKRYKRAVLILLILVVTFFAFYPSLKNDFVNWDDDVYVTENPLIRRISWTNVRQIFSSTFSAQYQPLIVISFMLEYRFFRLNPFVYHLNNLILHLFNCLLVFWLIFIISQKKIAVSFITALLFGIHPLHVESVAWISERKDVLYAFFFLLAIISYCYYLRGHPKLSVASVSRFLREHPKLSVASVSRFLREKYYCLALTAFLFSLLSKAMAVTLPAVLLLFDWFMQRKRARAMLTDKIPFFILSVIFGIIVVFTQYSGGSVRRSEPLGDIFHKLAVAGYAITFYLDKILMPIRLSCEYPLEKLPLSGYSVVLVTLLPIIIVLSRKYTKKIVFGSTFFLITILPVLHFIPVGTTPVADRYIYIPSIGIFYAIACGFLWLYAKRTRYTRWMRPVLVVLLTAAMCVLAFLTWERTQVWKDSITLWSDVLRNYPGICVPYNNRGIAYRERGNLNEAILDYNKAIQIEPDYAEAYNNRGVAYYRQGRLDQALLDYNKAIQIYSNYTAAHSNRGVVYYQQGRLDQALSDYNKAIQLNPEYAIAYYNRALLYSKQGNIDQALSDYNKAIQIDPNYAEASGDQGIQSLIEAQR